MEVMKQLDISFGIFIWCFYIIYLVLLHSPAKRAVGRTYNFQKTKQIKTKHKYIQNAEKL